MTTVAVIPARYASTRFPGKPLANDTGKYLIQHVCERVALARSVDRVLVATDDERIAEAVRSFGGEARMTREDHPSGTSRVIEAVESIDLTERDLVLNVQGDEPEVEPSALDLLVRTVDAEDALIGTLGARFPADGPREGPGSPQDPNCVKVVCDGMGRAMYFSRSLVPYPRASGGRVEDPSAWTLHVGVYAFRVKALRQMAEESREAPAGRDLAGLESLEQLAWLQKGLRIQVATIESSPPGIDTKADYVAFVERMKATA